MKNLSNLNFAAFSGNKSVPRIAFVVVSIAVLVALVLIGKDLCKDVLVGGAVLVRGDTIAPGYTLLPISRIVDQDTLEGEIRLISNDGVVVHEWTTELPPFMAYLQPNGDVYAALSRPLLTVPPYPTNGTTGIIERLNWEGDVLWRYEDPAMNHDFDVLPNGNIAYTRWEAAPAAFHYAVRGGISSIATTTWTNGVVVVDADKNIIWQWHLYDHVRAQDFVVEPFSQKSDWSHLNSIRYVADNPLTHAPAYLISARNINTVFLIDASSGNVLWSSPKGMLAVQHDAQLLENGNVLVFDNGFGRPMTGFLPISAAKEIDPRANKTVWNSKADHPLYEQLLASTIIQGGAERLASGNTLITLTMENRIIEVTKEGKTVWEYVNGYRDQQGLSHTVFKARKYDPAGTEWRKRLPITTFLAGAVCR